MAEYISLRSSAPISCPQKNAFAVFAADCPLSDTVSNLNDLVKYNFIQSPASMQKSVFIIFYRCGHSAASSTSPSKHFKWFYHIHVFATFRTSHIPRKVFTLFSPRTVRSILSVGTFPEKGCMIQTCGLTAVSTGGPSIALQFPGRKQGITLFGWCC